MNEVRNKIEKLAAYVGEDSGETSEIILEAVEEKLESLDLTLNEIWNAVYEICLGCKLHWENNCHDCELNDVSLEKIRKSIIKHRRRTP